MEYLQVFDENHNPLDESVVRSEKHNLSRGKYYMCSIVFIENSEGKFLMQKTSKHKQSCIAATGGHVVYGNSSLDTIIKESKEEIGLDLSNSNIIFICTLKDLDNYLDVYYVKYDVDINNLILQEEEVESVNWYTRDEIETFINENKFREGNIEAYRKVLNYLEEVL